ncbi:MAG TPA: farnesyl diphosphate synthase [Gammaproteobacteria bacterium]|nr:farnesyl diphosphate synthase [Gammaproteobacteria bacterium]
MTTWTEYTEQRRERINQVLAQVLPPANQEPTRLHQAMRYAVLTGGKRLRPLLVYATGETLGASLTELDIPAAAVELIHAYSLVHDDLPAMDDDDLRRGQPTCHKAFDEATAILTGDALQTLAFQLLADNQRTPTEQRLLMINSLAAACGSRGMAGGQALDLHATGKPLTLKDIETLYHLKTGALFAASVELGIHAANQKHTELTSLREYTKCLGLAFQIQDDILDIEGDLTTLGKIPGSDDKHEKSTYPVISGLAPAKARVASLRAEALRLLANCNENANILQELTVNMLRE